MADKMNEKMSLDDYMSKYNSKPYDPKKVKSMVHVVEATFGIVIFTMLFLVVLRIFDINEYAGYASIAVAVLLFIFLYILPILKIHSYKSFMTNVTPKNAKQALKHNKMVRNDIASKMIDITDKTEGLSWYDEAKIGKLAIAKSTNNEEELKKVLNDIYNTDVKKASNKLIRDAVLKVGTITALSQSEKVDTAIVVLFELDLIKKLVMLYGYRPNDFQLLKIYKTVLASALVAYGAQSATSGVITSGITKLGSSVAKSIPFLKDLAGSALDGAVNGMITGIIGFQTKKYLVKEYRLQEVLDNVEINNDVSEEAESELMSDVKEDLTKNKKQTANA